MTCDLNPKVIYKFLPYLLSKIDIWLATIIPRLSYKFLHNLLNKLYTWLATLIPRLSYKFIHNLLNKIDIWLATLIPRLSCNFIHIISTILTYDRREFCPNGFVPGFAVCFPCHWLWSRTEPNGNRWNVKIPSGFILRIIFYKFH